MERGQLQRLILKWAKTQGIVTSPLGEIKIENVIGEGGAGIVFQSPFLGGSAVKFLLDEFNSPISGKQKRFIDEYSIQAKLVHTGKVVVPYHFGFQQIENTTIPYVVMEYCRETLFSRFNGKPIQNFESLTGIVSEILSVLEAIHNAGAIHRDIKPHNILYRNGSQIVIGDFGIAWLNSDIYTKQAITDKGDRLANWEFSPPEQVRRENYDNPAPHMDLYSLGQTIYWLVSGQTIRGTKHKPLSSFSNELAPYDNLVEFLVSQEPGARPQSVSEVWKFLKETSDESIPSDSLDRVKKMIAQADEFDERLAQAIPGSINFAYTHVSDSSTINRVLRIVGKNADSYNLWWRADKHWTNPVSKVRLLQDTSWLIADLECKIIDMWVFRCPSRERQFIAMQMGEVPPIDGIGGVSLGHQHVAMYRGRYIPMAEYEDGYTLGFVQK